MKLVVSQPMFIPWIGLFEQIKLSDLHVHYDDVQLPRGGSFIPRVQIKTCKGPRWLSAQIDRRRSGELISDTLLLTDSDWRQTHLALLEQHYRGAPHRELMMRLAAEIYSLPDANLAKFNEKTIEYLAGWLDLDTNFAVSSELDIDGSSTDRLVSICKHFGATDYLTGHGAAKYLDHELFESNGIDVSYMQYALHPYEQLHGDFDPFVTILDAIANVGERTKEMLLSRSIGWREFVAAGIGP